MNSGIACHAMGFFFGGGGAEGRGRHGEAGLINISPMAITAGLHTDVLMQTSLCSAHVPAVSTYVPAHILAIMMGTGRLFVANLQIGFELLPPRSGLSFNCCFSILFRCFNLLVQRSSSLFPIAQ